MIQLPKFDTFNKEEVLPFPEVTAPGVVTVSEIKQTYTELGVTRLVDGDGDTVIQPNQWNVGVQESTVDGEIISRTFAELTFDKDAYDFQFEPNPTDVQFGGLATWRVIHRFTEKKYESNYTPDLQNFKIWQIFNNKWQQEIIYDHVEINSLEWNRNQIEVTPIVSTTGGTGVGAGVISYSCPTTAPDPAPIGETGESNVISETISNPELGQPDIKCYRWASIKEPFSVIFDVGEALGGFVEFDGSITSILLRDDPNPDLDGIPDTPTESVVVTNGSINNPIKFSKRYLQIFFELPSSTTPTYVKLRRYGQERFRFQIPFQIDLDPEISNHSSSATFEERLKPPMRSDFPDNFWNSGSNVSLGDYSSRVGSIGGVSTSV